MLLIFKIYFLIIYRTGPHTGFPVKNDPLYNHVVFGPEKGRGGVIGKTDEQLIHDLINIHNAENWLGMDGDSELMPVLKDVDDEGKKTPPGKVQFPICPGTVVGFRPRPGVYSYCPEWAPSAL